MHFSDINYYKFSHELNLLTDPSIEVSYNGEQLVLEKTNLPTRRSALGASSQTHRAIIRYLKEHEPWLRNRDLPQLKKMEIKLLETLSGDPSEQEKLSALIEGLTDKVKSNTQQPTDHLPDAAIPLVFRIAKAPEDLEAFKKNVRLVINQYPRYQFGQDLAVYDTTHGKIPAGWNPKNIYEELKEMFEVYQFSLSQDSLENNSTLNELTELRQICEDLMKPLIPVKIGLIIETNALNTENTAMCSHVESFVNQGLPLIVNRYLLGVHETRLKEVLKNSDLYTQAEGPLCVIVPKGQHPEDLGFQHTCLTVMPYTKAKTRTPSANIPQNLKNILKDSNPEGKFARLVFISGHGSYPGFPHALDPSQEGKIAGMSLRDYQESLDALNPVFAVNSSCFFGGNIDHASFPQGIIRCPILVRSTFAISSLALRGDQLLREAEGLLFGKNAFRAGFHFPSQLQQKDMRDVMRKLSKQPRLENLPQVIMPANLKDIPKVPYQVHSSSGSNKAGKTAANTQLLGKNQFLFSEPTTKGLFTIQGSLPAIFLSKGSNSHHLIEQITAPDQSLEKIAGYTFNAFRHSAKETIEPSSKGFFIAKMTCKFNGTLQTLNHVLIKNTPDVREVIFRVEGDHHYYRMQFHLSTKPKGGKIVWEKDDEQELLSPQEAIYEFYETAAKTKASDQTLWNTTAGRAADQNFLEALKENFWSEDVPLEAELLSAVLHNKRLFTKTGEEKKAYSSTLLDKALALLKANSTLSEEDKNRLLRKAVDIASFSDQAQEVQIRLIRMTYTPLMDAVRDGTLGDVETTLKEDPESINAVQLNGANALQIAILLGKEDIAQLLIEKGAQMDAEDRFGITPLSQACLNGQIDIVAKMLKAGLDVKGAAGRKALTCALKNKHAALCSFLLDHQAGIDSPGSLLLDASYLEGRAKLIKQLLNYPAINVNQQTNALKNTPLHVCIHHQDPKSCNLLLTKKANPKMPNSKGKSPLHFAVLYGGDAAQEIIRMLLQHQANINAQDQEGNTPLHQAILKQDLPLIKQLIENGACMDLENKAHFTPLEIASADPALFQEICALKQFDPSSLHALLLKTLERGDLDCAKFLMKQGADINHVFFGLPIIFHYLQKPNVNRAVMQFLIDHAQITARDSEGNTVLHYAVSSTPEAAKMLIHAGISPGSRNLKGETPFSVLANSLFAKEEMLQLFIEQTSALTEKEIRCYAPKMLSTPFKKTFFEKFIFSSSIENPTNSLHRAIFNNDISMVKSLLETHPGIASKEFFGFTALHSVFYFSPGLAIVLVSLLLPSELNTPDASGNTPLHLALKNKDILSAQLLIKAGAKLDAADPQGASPLSLAIQANSEELVANILECPTIDINSASSTSTPLLYALKMDNKNIFELITAKNPNPNYTLKPIIPSPLHFLARSGKKNKHQLAFAEQLLSMGAKIDAVDASFSTPLQVALKNKNLALAKFLIKKGANCRRKNKEEISALEFVEIHRYGALVKMMND